MVAPLDMIDNIGAGAGGGGVGVGAGGSTVAPGAAGVGASEASDASDASDASENKLIHVETEEQLEALKRGPRPCVIDFFAEWCGPCRAIAGRYAMLPAEFPGVLFAKVNIETVQVADVTSLPTFQLWRAGVRIGESMGADIAKVRALALAAMARSYTGHQ